MKVAIITPAFVDFNSGYSLTSIVRDQVHMLTRHGHEVEVWVGDSFYDKDPGFTIKKIIPVSKRPGWIDYRTIKDYYDLGNSDEVSVIRPDTQEVIPTTDHLEISEKFAGVLVKHLADVDIVLTHDVVFTGWNLPLYMGIERVAMEKVMQHVRWFHWVHSCPTHGFDWWRMDNLGRFHRLVYPNTPDAVFCWEGWKTTKDYVKVIPHIKDIRLVNRFLPETWEFIDKYPAVLHADVVQIYPASVDRLEPKRLRELILLFKYIKQTGASVCLVCANQWATGRQQKEEVSDYYELALSNGLTLKEFIFTSDFKPEYGVGIPYDMLMDLFKLSNLFIFPTVSESFGLVLPEAILSGCVLPVINHDLPQLSQITGFRGLHFQFGSHRNVVDWGDAANTEARMEAIANTCYETLCREETIAARTHIRKTLNMDYIYKRFYGPALHEARMAW